MQQYAGLMNGNLTLQVTMVMEPQLFLIFPKQSNLNTMPISIALADDHQLVRKGIRLLLENLKEFKVVHEACNGKELIANIEAATTHPDLVLIDVNMPVMSGQETLKYLWFKIQRPWYNRS